MSCNECNEYPLNTDNCIEECGCDFEILTSCVRHEIGDLPCINKPKGSLLDDILIAIDEKLCEASTGSNLNVLYREDLSLSGIGSWEIDPATGILLEPNIVFGAVPNYSYTVPTGGDGNYEVTYQSTLVSYTDYSGGAVAIFKNGTIVPTSLAMLTNFDMVFSNLSMFMDEISLVAGDTIEVKIALSSEFESSLAFTNNKLRITKKPL